MLESMCGHQTCRQVMTSFVQFPNGINGYLLKLVYAVSQVEDL